MVMVLMMDRELMEVGARELPATTGTYPGEQPQRLLTVSGHARVRLLAGLGHDRIEPNLIQFAIRRTTRPIT